MPTGGTVPRVRKSGLGLQNLTLVVQLQPQKNTKCRPSQSHQPDNVKKGIVRCRKVGQVGGQLPTQNSDKGVACFSRDGMKIWEARQSAEVRRCWPGRAAPGGLRGVIV